MAVINQLMDVGKLGFSVLEMTMNLLMRDKGVQRFNVHCPQGAQHKAGSLKMNTALEYSTRVVQEGGRRCKKSTLNDLVHLTPLRIPLMNPPIV